MDWVSTGALSDRPKETTVENSSKYGQRYSTGTAADIAAANVDPKNIELGAVAEEKPQLGNPGNEDRLECWDPEDPTFWESYGNSRQNLNILKKIILRFTRV